MAIHALVGHSATGKSTVERILEEMGMERIIGVTTRPPRDTEKDGVDYHFVNIQRFMELYRSGYLAEHNAYRGWHYGTSLEGIDYVSKDYVVVLDPNGLRNLKEKLGTEYVIGYYLYSEERERMIRLALRGDDVDEIIRRLMADRDLFKGIEDEADYIVKSSDADETATEIYYLASVEKLMTQAIQEVINNEAN